MTSFGTFLYTLFSQLNAGGGGRAFISNLGGGPGVNLKPAFYRSPGFIYEVFIFLSFYEVDLLSLYLGDTGKKFVDTGRGIFSPLSNFYGLALF